MGVTGPLKVLVHHLAPSVASQMLASLQSFARQNVLPEVVAVLPISLPDRQFEQHLNIILSPKLSLVELRRNSMWIYVLANKKG